MKHWFEGHSKKVWQSAAMAAVFYLIGIPSGYAALTVPVSGSLTATAIDTSAVSTSPSPAWTTAGTERYAWNTPPWLEYQIDFGASGSFVFSMTAINKNGTPPALPANYQFNIDVAVDGTWKTSIGILGSTTTYQTGNSNAVTLSGIHTVRFTWINDAWSSGQYDANIRVQSISITRQGVTDTTPPTISSVASSSITSTGAIITWTTNEVATSQVEYGTTTGYGQNTTLDTTLITAHTVNLSGLSAATLYHYRVKSKDAAGNQATGADATFTTTAAPDTTSPTVTITVPAAAAFVRGTALSVTADASDNVGVVGVQFKLDGANLGTEDAAAPYSTTWDTRTAADGTHSLTAVARDAAGNTQTSTAVSITVDNTPPVLTISSPADGQIITIPSP